MGAKTATVQKKHVKGTKSDEVVEMPEFSVSVTPFEREGSNIRGLARIFFEEGQLHRNNVTILQGKDSLFVTMPSYKTNQVDEQGKSIYNDICYPVTKEFREKLYAGILVVYEREKEKQQEQSQSKAEEKAKDDFMKAPDKELPFG